MRPVAILLTGLGAGILLGRQAAAPKSIVEAKLTNVVLTTSKMDAEASFYENTLGFMPFYHDRTSIFLKTGSANLALVRAKSNDAASKRICLDVGVPSVPDAAQQLKNARITFDHLDPAILTLHDPDGNLVEIVKG